MATAAVISSGLSAFAATGTASDHAPQAEQATQTPSEEPSEAVVAEPTEDAAATKQPSEAPEPPREPKPRKAEKAEKPQPAAKPEKDAGRVADKGNAHGKAVSAAAKGDTEPVGDCRNHGHWVSTVAKGLASCDDNPRPAGGPPPGRGPDND